MAFLWKGVILEEMEIKKAVNWFTYLMVAIGIYFFVVKPMIINKYLLATNSVSTYGKVIKKQGTARGGPDYIFVYKVAGKEYQGFFAEDTRYNVEIGDCFVVNYYVKNPSIASIDLDDKTNCK